MKTKQKGKIVSSSYSSTIQKNVYMLLQELVCVKVRSSNYLFINHTICPKRDRIARQNLQVFLITLQNFLQESNGILTQLFVEVVLHFRVI